MVDLVTKPTNNVFASLKDAVESGLLQVIPTAEPVATGEKTPLSPQASESKQEATTQPPPHIAYAPNPKGAVPSAVVVEPCVPPQKTVERREQRQEGKKKPRRAEAPKAEGSPQPGIPPKVRSEKGSKQLAPLVSLRDLKDVGLLWCLDVMQNPAKLRCELKQSSSRVTFELFLVPKRLDIVLRVDESSGLFVGIFRHGMELSLREIWGHAPLHDDRKVQVETFRATYELMCKERDERKFAFNGPRHAVAHVEADGKRGFCGRREKLHRES